MPKFPKNTSPAMYKSAPFKMKGFKYLFAGPKGRKRQDAEFENKIRMKHNAPRILREVTVVGKKNDRDKGPEVGN